MKILVPFNPRRGTRAHHRRMAGLTLVEMITTAAIFSLVVGAFVYANMFGLRYDELTCNKLGASEQARLGFDLLTADIRSAKTWRVGGGGSNSFTAIANGTMQRGNAIQLSPTSDTNYYVRYYFDTNNAEVAEPKGRLNRITSDGSYKMIANYLTNNMYFTAENYLGQAVTNLSYKYVLATMMEFCQYQYPITYVGPGYYYDYYRIQFKVTPHNPDGP